MAINNQSPYLQNIFNIMKLPAVKQVIFLIGISISIATGIYIYSAIQEPFYKPLDYKITDKNAGTISDALDKANVNYKVSDGVLLVAGSDMQRAKYILASAGVQKDDNFNFSYLNSPNGIGESSFIENARYLRALESDLVKTITAIDGISNAKIHLAIPTNNMFADEHGSPTASVFITVSRGLVLEKEKVRSIIQLVASSVPGLAPENVSVTDQYGHYLSQELSEDSLKTAEQMNYKNNIQNYYEKRIESMINPIIGLNKVNVRVHAEIDFSQQEEAKEQYDPDQKVVRSEETTTEETGSTGGSGAPGSLSNAPPSSGGDSAKSQTSTSQGRSQSIKNYELGKLVTYKKSNIAKIVSLSVAVVVDDDVVLDPKTKKEIAKPVDPQKISKITDLIKASIGYDEKRGDRVTVVNSSFNIAKIDSEPVKTAIWQEIWFWDLIKKISSIIFAIIMLTVLYRTLFKHFFSIKNPVNGNIGSGGDNEDGLSPEMKKLKQEQINHLRELASKDPTRVALVIRNWVAEK